jgi:hypothetical protein
MLLWLLQFVLSPCPIAAQAPAADERVDVVLMMDGIHWEGRIIEHVPGHHVVLDVDGEHRVIAYAEVFFAGPVAGLPDARARWEQSRNVAIAQTPPFEVAPDVQNTEVEDTVDDHEVTSSGSGLTLHLRGALLGADVRERSRPGSAANGWTGSVSTSVTLIYDYEQLCTAPCTTSLRRGSHFFQITDAEGRVYTVRGAVITNGPGTLSLSVRPRFRVRRALLTTMFVGLAVGAVGLSRGLRDIRSEPGGGPLYLPGTTVGVVFSSITSGLTMAFGGARRLRGRVEFTVDPSVPADELGTEKERMERELLRQQRLRDGADGGTATY